MKNKSDLWGWIQATMRISFYVSMRRDLLKCVCTWPWAVTFRFALAVLTNQPAFFVRTLGIVFLNLLSSSLLTCVPGGGHPGAWDRRGWAAGYAQWRWAGSQGQGRIQIYTCVKAFEDTQIQKTKYIFRLSFIALQELLVDCFKPTEVSLFLPSFHPSAPWHFTPISLHCGFVCFWIPCVLSLLSPRRTLSQSCSTRSEGCRSSPRLRRNDGIPPPPLHLPFRLSPHFSSSYCAFHPFILMSVFFHWRSSWNTELCFRLSLGPLSWTPFFFSFHLFPFSCCLDPAP